jgi:dipeptidyl aminopeptidase/acylaminoacyl peptidase
MTDKRRSLTAHDLYLFHLISQPQISSQGELAVYCEHLVDEETEKKYAHLWAIQLPDGEPRQMTYGKQSDVNPRFSPDGTTIAFLSNREDEKQPQIYLLPVNGGEARRLTDLKGQIQAFFWSPDGRRLLLQFRAKDAEDVEREKDEEKKKLGVVFREVDRVFYKEDGVGFLPRGRTHLWTVDVQTGQTKQITEGDVYDEWGPAWSPDGNTVVFCSNHSKDPDLDPDAVDIYLMPSDGGEMRCLPTPVGPKSSPSFSPDGSTIAYYGYEGKAEGWKQTRLWMVATKDEKEALCITCAYDFNVSPWTINDMGSLPQVAPTWSKNGENIYFQVAHHGNTVLKKATLDGKVSDVIDRDGVVGVFSFDREQDRLVYFHGDMKDLAQVFLLDMKTGDDKQLTHVNSQLLDEIDLGGVEEVWFEGPAGNNLQGWIITPPGFDTSKKYPSILEIHGGPRVQYGNFFMHEFYYLAAQGYVVYFCNPRGGQGYGEQHSKAIWNDWGGADYEDITAWVDYMAQKSYIDKARMGVTGGSYGGFMTNWIIGHTDRFAAAVTQRSVSNLISMYGSSDFNWAFQEEFGNVAPWEDVENYWRQSPMKYIGKAVTPTLVIHSENDMRCPIEQGEQVFVALKRLGVDTKMVRFPDEPHGLSRDGRTDRRIARLEHVRDWFDNYLKV